MIEMPSTRRHRRAASRRAMRGSGYATSQQFFDPAVMPPAASAFSGTVSTAPTPYEIRPVLHSTFQAGGKTRRMSRAQRAGFSPSVMGGFIPNAQAAIVPAAMYAAYHFLVPKKSSRRSGGRRTRRSRKH
jgi:hypothetical protein